MIPSRKIEAAPPSLDIGMQHHQAGRLDEAEAVYRSLLQANPADPDALHLLGVVAIQRRRFREAIDLLSQSVALEPSNPHAHNHLGEAYRGLQYLDEAAACFETALRIDARCFQAHNNLGNVQQARGRTDVAFACYQKAIEIKPDYCEAHTNLGNILFEHGKFEAAIDAYRRALAIRPDFAEACYNLGNVFKVQRNYVDAIPLYQRTLASRPDFVDAHLALARSYQEFGERDKALESFRRASLLDAENPEPRWGSVMSQLALVEASEEAVAEHRRSFAQGLSELDEWFDARRVDTGFNALGTQQAFYLAYQEENNRELLRQYGSLCGRLAARWQEAQGLKLRRRAGGNKVRVGIVSAHVCHHSVWDALTKGWVEHLDERRFELHIFALGTQRDGETDLARSRAEGFVQGLTKSRQWADEILARSIDVLIYPEIGMDPMTAKLAALRLAPVQVTTWGHPETSGLPSIDYYLSAESFEPERAQDHYTEKLVLLPNLSCCYRPAKAEHEEVSLADFGVDADVPVFVCPGTPFKYAPRHDAIFPAVAKKLRKCKFLFFKYPNENLTRQLLHRIEGTFARHGLDAGDYVVELPWLRKPQFFGIMRRADAYLDTVGFSGFNSAMQAIQCGIPVITREGRFMRGRFASAILGRMGLSSIVCASDDAHIDLAVRIGQDRSLRTSIQDRMAAMRDGLYDDLSSVRALEDFLTRVGGGSAQRTTRFRSLLSRR